MYTTQLCFQVFGNNIKVCAILRVKMLHKIPIQLSFFSPQKNNLANFRHNFDLEKQLRICNNCNISFQTKITNIKNSSIFQNTFTANVFARDFARQNFTVGLTQVKQYHSNTYNIDGHSETPVHWDLIYILIAKKSGIKNIETDQQWSI